MKILLVSSSSGSRGGGELYLLYLGRALQERGHTVLLWASTHPRMDELAQGFAPIGEVIRSDYQNTYDRRFRSLASYFDSATARRVAAEWRTLGVDFLHLNKQNLEDGLDLLQATQLSGIPNLSTIHLTQSAKYLRAVMAAPRDWVARRALLAYRGFMVTVLQNRHQDLVDFLGDSKRARNIPNGVPMLDLSRRPQARTRRAEFGVAENELLFVAVGRMVPQKRPMVFLETAEAILARVPQARFLWVGDGGLTEAWDQWVAAKGLGARIQRLPWQKDVPALLLAADVFLHVAEFEGLPLAILEAMSAGLPCAITENLLGEMPFLNSTNSIAVDPAGQWISRLGSEAELAAIGQAARALAEAEFSFDTMAQRYEALYEQTLHPTA